MKAQHETQDRIWKWEPNEDAGVYQPLNNKIKTVKRLLSLASAVVPCQ